MYHAKRRGRARSEVFNEDLRRDTVERLSVEKALRRALDRGEFVLHLQPIVDTHTGRVLGAEALVRWERPDRGLVGQASFIPVAEDCGLIGRIDAWVLDEAKRQCAAYRRQRCDPDRLVLEITESVYAEAVNSTLVSLQKLRSMKVRLALDDFGTGYSSLTFIKRYPFDIIKIDQSFIRGMLDLAARMDSLHCGTAQGYTWSRPVLLAELVALPPVLLPH